MDQRAEERGGKPLTAAPATNGSTNGSNGSTNGSNGSTNGAAHAGDALAPNGSRPQPPVTTIAVLIPTHNDGGTIEPLLRRVLDEPGVGDVVVVASGCDDDTVSLVSETAAGDARVQLFVEAERSGKAAAINFGMAQRLRLPFVVIISGDVLPAPGAVSMLVDALAQPGVGLAGGRPVPDNPASTAMGHASHLLWRLHHRLALQQPKLGEMIAIRTEAVVALPRTSVDEACFQSLLETAGWKARYIPEALVANRGP
ncbi:MAG TPA: glycosyltransferase, partial [Acidimicrobiales bacterium]